jgi:hypothetical protein
MIRVGVVNYAIEFRNGAETVLFRFLFHFLAGLAELSPLLEIERTLRLGALISNASHPYSFHTAVTKDSRLCPSAREARNPC